MKRLFVFACATPLVIGLFGGCSVKTEAFPAPSPDASVAATDSGSDAGSSEPDGGTPGPAPEAPEECTAARKTFLGPVAKVSTGEVTVVGTENGVMTLYVDASAGGGTQSASNPRVYITLSGARVNINDNEAFTSSNWDLALKRVDIFTNSGDAGPGKGGAAVVTKAFENVTASDADKAEIGAEDFFDEECNGRRDEASFIITTFSGWYDYAVGGGPSVRPNQTFIVRGADGTSRYKVGIVSYTGKSDGSTDGQATGRFLLKAAAL